MFGSAPRNYFVLLHCLMLYLPSLIAWVETITCQYFVIYTLHIYDKHRCIPRQQKLGKKTFYSISLSLELFAKSRFPSSPNWNLDPPSINTLSRIYIFINSYNMVPVHRFKHQYVFGVFFCGGDPYSLLIPHEQIGGVIKYLCSPRIII